jgi:hypothetical protein
MELVEDGSPIGGFLDLRGPSTGKKTQHIWEENGNSWGIYGIHIYNIQVYNSIIQYTHIYMYNYILYI